ncbi:hypothetical protein GCM10010365_05870 [Streptomyces poonensis]|uniref:Membrane transport protein MMPL domain-containing protein n=1 Tax=Streptomyces poonensis TaxID=68255 RepID=A0A918P8C0_9ACTN|nr:hypothetical protein GCM10010365_05870 [Streptomyces poonensis]GLJ87976.1 hypothetical protein GCM10017589_05760 [Streptomyces poonensis]
MAALLHRIGRLAFRRRGLAVLLWAVVLGAVGAAAVSTTSTNTTGLTLPGTESQRAIDLLKDLVDAIRKLAVGTEADTGTRSMVVTAAALIMITVFTGFVGSHDLTIKSIGFGLAVAVACDAFVVRMTIVPAVLALLGDRAWWLPHRLDRLVPDVDIEGGKLTGGAQPSSDRTSILTRSGTAQR